MEIAGLLDDVRQMFRPKKEQGSGFTQVEEYMFEDQMRPKGPNEYWHFAPGTKFVPGNTEAVPVVAKEKPFFGPDEFFRDGSQVLVLAGTDSNDMSALRSKYPKVGFTVYVGHNLRKVYDKDALGKNYDAALLIDTNEQDGANQHGLPQKVMDACKGGAPIRIRQSEEVPHDLKTHRDAFAEAGCDVYQDRGVRELVIAKVIKN